MVVQSRITAVTVDPVRRVVDRHEHQQMHQTQICQQKRSTDLVGDDGHGGVEHDAVRHGQLLQFPLLLVLRKLPTEQTF